MWLVFKLSGDPMVPLNSQNLRGWIDIDNLLALLIANAAVYLDFT